MSKRHYLQLSVILASCFLALLLLFSFGSRPVERAGEKIEIILKARKNPPDFWRVVEQGVLVAAAEFGVHCSVTAPARESDVEGQIQLMRQAIERKPSAIILAASDYERMAPVCKEAVSRGIVLVTLDSDVNAGGQKCFVATDNYEMGQKLAALVDETVGPQGKIGVIAHVKGTTTAEQRLAGLLEAIGEDSGRLVALEYCEGSEELSRQRTIAMLEAHPEIQCMVGLNESSALGITLAIQDLGREELPLIACDSSQKQIEYMEHGIIRAFVVQNPFNMGYLSVQNTVRLLRGETVPPVVRTQSVVIRKEDLYKKENEKLIFPFSSGH